MVSRIMTYDLELPAPIPFRLALSPARSLAVPCRRVTNLSIQVEFLQAIPSTV